MTHQKRFFNGLWIALLMLPFYIQSTNAQTVAEIINNSDNSIVFRIENLESESSPTKILLVYDSNLITLETTSAKSKMYRAKSNSPSTMNYISTSALASIMAVEIEKEIELEEWMLVPFPESKKTNNYLSTDSEDEIALESWMYDLNSW